MTTWLLNNSLWLAALGLMLASSGMDGAYMAKIMEPSLWPLGYVLNTMSDVSGLVIMYAFGRLQQERKNSKKWKLSRVLLGAELVAVAYSWFFSWRQLLRTLQPMEQANTQWVAPIAAGFIPLLLAFIGWAQALQAGKFDEQKSEQDEQVEQPPVLPEQPPVLKCKHCGAAEDKVGNPWSNTRALRAHESWCKRNASGVLAEGKEASNV